MPRVPLHALTWSREQNLYELYTQGQLQQRFRPAEEAAWLAWLGSVSSFAFHSPGGSLNVYLERRPRGGVYWYAYHTSQERTRKRYLGRTENLSLARLEETAQTLLREQQPTQALDQGMLVLSGRLAPPRLPKALVEREHLLATLDGALATPLTLLSASAGWGKTTLLSAWAGRHTAQVAWLSLDELDNSPTRFWVSLIAALRHCGGYAPSFGETAVALLQSPQPPSPSTILTALLQELENREAHPAPIVLIVDDYQVIEEHAIHQGMSFFLEHLPAKVHLILSSRVDPDLPLARWRVRGQLTEVRAADLPFREVEASQFLGQMLSLPLQEAEVQRLLSRTLDTANRGIVPVWHRRAASFYEAQGEWAEAITHALQAADYSTAARLMEQTVEQFWLRGEAATVTRWVLALPEVLAGEHARLLFTTALYLLNTVVQTTREQRSWFYQEARQLMARVEAALQAQTDETNSQISATGADAGDVDRGAQAAEHALLQRRLRLLRRFMAVIEATASGDFERLSRMQEVIEEALDQDEEAIWQTVPLRGSFTIHYTVRREGAQLLPRLLEVKERVSRSASRYANIKVRQWLALAAVRSGQLRLAYEEGQAALNLIEQMQGFALLKGDFEIALAQVCYQWNRLEEARDLLQMVVHNAAAWQQLELLAWGYAELIQVELARRDRPAAQQALHEVEQLVQRERFGIYPGWLPTMQAQWWLAQGQLEAASKWAASVVFPEEAWEGRLYGAFPVVIRMYFAERRWREALDLLERWSGHLDRPANIEITIIFLAQSLVALHQAGKNEQARMIAARLLALTEPEGYLRVYLDEGEPMRQALQALLTPHSQQHELASSTTAYVAKLLAAFEQEEQGVSTPVVTAITSQPALSSAPQASAVSFVPGVSLTRREQEVLHLLAAGASNQEIAQTLVISLDTVKKHVSNLLGKLGAYSRTQAIIQARALSLL